MTEHSTPERGGFTMLGDSQAGICVDGMCSLPPVGSGNHQDMVDTVDPVDIAGERER
ncbi:hypothetical protein ABT332_02925 [Saccharomonospora azurea]|uniref:hypothetical protein n=1 Tax=Saccharomonospora azurea TaxID=40988 RepID=UPI0033182B86